MALTRDARLRDRLGDEHGQHHLAPSEDDGPDAIEGLELRSREECVDQGWSPTMGCHMVLASNHVHAH